MPGMTVLVQDTPGWTQATDGWAVNEATGPVTFQFDAGRMEGMRKMKQKDKDAIAESLRGLAGQGSIRRKKSKMLFQDVAYE